MTEETKTPKESTALPRRRFVRDAAAAATAACLSPGLLLGLPHLSPDTTRKVLRYGWQTAAGLYSIAPGGPSDGRPAAVELSREDLIDRAVANGDEHAIKLTEACLRETRSTRGPSTCARRATRPSGPRLN